jgi:hypothetical protein
MQGERKYMKHAATIVALALFSSLPFCSAQTASHKSVADAKQQPTTPELVEYVRSALLTLSPTDGINDNVDVAFDPISKVMTVTSPAGHCDLFLDALNTNNATWDEFDASDSSGSREVLLRLTLVSVAGRPARTCYDKQNHADTTLLGNRARLLFSYSRAADVPGFQDKLGKSFKKLVVLSGGAPERKFN